MKVELNNLNSSIGSENGEIESETDSSAAEEFHQPIEYSKSLCRNQISILIQNKMDSQSVEERWLKCIESLSVDQIDFFRKKFKNLSNSKELVRKLAILFLFWQNFNPCILLNNSISSIFYPLSLTKT